jgi:hypothetical protein
MAFSWELREALIALGKILFATIIGASFIGLGG